ncbi:glycosyltransferase family 4 protein [uncultured Nostoc sp.]|uniref:glycosyltransferase family 4 protein n=1 Tax=uncultured Nostoc sp. TaxID=340711 RepID=UPI0035CBDBBD
MDKLRILIITNLYPPQVIGGYERAIADYARLLHHRGHTVLVLTSNTEEYTNTTYTNQEPKPVVYRGLHLCGEWTKQGTHWFSLEEVASRTFLNRQIVAQELQTFQPDVCLAGNIDFLGLELLEKMLADGIPIAHYVMNATPGYISELTPKSQLHQYITCSNWIRDSLKQHGYPVNTTQTIYPGAAVEEFYQTELPPRDRLRIAYASLVMPYKGADILIEALSLLDTGGMEFSATIAGGTLIPEFTLALQEFVESEGMQDKVKFPGALSRQELKQLYQTHNVLVFPSRFQEPFGISQVEAMAAGLTLVTSGTGGAGEIVQHSKDGLVFESENPLDLADVLCSLPVSPTEWERITRAGQQRAMSDLSQLHTIEQLESVLFKLVSIKI